jgi:sugar phosphate permease
MGDNRRGIYWGWYVVLGAFLIMGINYGARYSFGIFVKPMALEYHWSRSVISAGMSILVLGYGIGGILSGRLIDRIAPRWLITAGSALVAAGLFLTPFVREPWQFYITYGLFGGFGSACFGAVVCNSSVGKWFIRKRGMAIGAASIGIGIATMVLAPLAGWVVKVYGWRVGFLGLGGIVLVVGVGLSQGLMGKTRPEDYGLLPDGGGGTERGSDATSAGGPRLGQPLGQILRDSRFWILAVCYSLAYMAEMSAMVHQVPYALDQRIDRIAAASSLGMIGMASVLGRFFFGWLSDRIRDAKYAAAIGLFFMTAGMIFLLKADTVTLLFSSALLFGFGYGSMAPMMPCLLADRFGRHILGTAYGMLTFFVAIGGSLGPIITGYIYDLSGTYTLAWLLNLSVLLMVTFLILALKPAGRMRRPEKTFRSGVEGR